MNVRMKTAIAALAALALTTVGPVASTQASGHQPGHASKGAKVYTLVPSTPDNNPEGVAWDRRSRAFFVGTVGTGTIYRATLRGGHPATVHHPRPSRPGGLRHRDEGVAGQALRGRRPDGQHLRLPDQNRCAACALRNRSGRLPQRSRRDPRGTRLCHRLLPPDPVARHAPHAAGRQRDTAQDQRRTGDRL